MTVTTTRYIRKPLYVDAVLVTEENFEEVAEWCQGEILVGNAADWKLGESAEEEKKYIKVQVYSPKYQRQTQAFVGDWVLSTGRGFKVYTDRAFQGAFNEMHPLTPLPIETESEILESEPTKNGSEGKRVLSVEEQKDLSPDELRELLKSGEAVLAQDL